MMMGSNTRLGRSLAQVAVLLALLLTTGIGFGPVREAVAQARQFDLTSERALADRTSLNDLIRLRGRMIAARDLYLFVGDRASALNHLGPNLNSRMAGLEKLLGKDGARPLQQAEDEIYAVAQAGG